MTTYSFLDDYSEGCHPEILEALGATNLDQLSAYGTDHHTARARRLIAGRCHRPEAAVHLVSGGTLANLILCAALLRPHEAVIAAQSGHIVQREAGAIEATGHKIITVPSDDGRLTPDGVARAVAANGLGPHMAKPRLVYISNATELGTVYDRAELAALADCCRANELLLMVDGARLGAALASDRCRGLTMAEVAETADAFWVGGTKAGTLLGEAIVVPDPELASEIEFHIKQRGALLAKGRALGVQMATLFEGDLFERASAHGNAMASQLSAGVRAAGHDLVAETESNQVFPILPDRVVEALRADFAFHPWEARDDETAVVRLVTSWATDEAQVERFVAAVARA